METAGGLRRCFCPRGRELRASDIRRQQAAAQKGAKAAEKAEVKKKARRDEWITQRASERRLARQFRELPLMDEPQV